jgi:hypothetical protein
MSPKPEVKLAVVYGLILGIRRIHDGRFAGLWEVVELDGKGNVVRVITDANTKSMAAGLAAGAISRCL